MNGVLLLYNFLVYGLNQSIISVSILLLVHLFK